MKSLFDELLKRCVLDTFLHQLLYLRADLHAILLAEILKREEYLILNSHRNFYFNQHSPPLIEAKIATRKPLTFALSNPKIPDKSIFGCYI